MTLPGHIRKKLALLVPRLGSEFDGEIIATVGAIGRTLAAEGRDLHDLADVIRGDVRPPGPHTPAPPAPFRDWRGTVRFCRLYGVGILSPWEFEFIESLAEAPRWRQLSPKQAARLDDIEAKLRIRRSA